MAAWRFFFYYNCSKSRSSCALFSRTARAVLSEKPSDLFAVMTISMVTEPSSAFKLRMISSRNALMSSREMSFWIVFVITMRLGPADGGRSGGISIGGSSGTTMGGEVGINDRRCFFYYELCHFREQPIPLNQDLWMTLIHSKHNPSYSSPL